MDSIKMIELSPSELQAAKEGADVHFRAQIALAQSRQAEIDALMDRINAPSKKLIEANSDATSALRELQDREVEIDRFENNVALFESRSVQTFAPQVFAVRPPYNPSSGGAGVYQGSQPAHSVFNRPSDGYVGMDARSGSIDGGASGSVSAFSGFTLGFQPSANAQYTTGFQIDNMHFAYNVACRSVTGGSAVAEGGLLAVVLDILGAGSLVIAGRIQLWHKRVSGGETSHDSQSGLRRSVQLNPAGLYGGRRYALICQLYCNSDRSSGVGAAASQSLGEGYITAMVAVA